jgi:dipicolinate synthase subunit B
MNGIRVGFALCGSFCTFGKVMPEFEKMAALGYDLYPIMSNAAYTTDTRFGEAAFFIRRLEEISGKKVISTLVQAEPIGPKKMLDVIVIAPCTGNTLAKLANAISDLPGIRIDAASVETNIVIFDVADAPSFVARLKELGVLAAGVSKTTVRLVTHLDVDDSGIDRAMEVLRRVASS